MSYKAQPANVHTKRNISLRGLHLQNKSTSNNTLKPKPEEEKFKQEVTLILYLSSRDKSGRNSSEQYTTTNSRQNH